ncbi:uromodulin-like isoform X2 [Pseudorasbora parva]|uniref:uromodulin-like isoform X2 n=1 Tax=Pseudorasbora parva TaxID=51549 RepID=UPI00351EB0E1
MRFLISLCVTLLLLNNGNRCSELNCTEDERCEEENGVYGCFCKDNRHRSQHDFGFFESCESGSGFMSLSRCQLFEAGFPPDILHLNDPSCRGTVRNGRVEFYFDNKDHICGTSLMANGTHFIYDNFILGDSGSEAIISRENKLRIHFSCVYSQSFSMNINPLESIVHGILPAGQGTYQVRMIPFQDAEFSRPFTGSVNVELNERVFVEARVDGVDSRQFASVIDKCWATPVNDPHCSLRWDLINDLCPSPNVKVELLQSGVSTSSRFSFSMFMLTANSTKVYLHCTLHLCLLSNNHCPVLCDSEQGVVREGRSAVIHDSTYISIGPLMWSEHNKGEQLPNQVQVSRAPSLCASLMILLISMTRVFISF